MRTRSCIPWLIFTSVILVATGGKAQAQSSAALPEVPMPAPSQAIPATSVVSQQRARQYASPVRLYPGRSSVIDFSSTDEVITYIQLSDISRIVYDINAPIDSGAARTIILRPIQALHIEGSYTAAVPNLVVTTTDPAGHTYTYLFDLYRSPTGFPDQSEASGIAIAPASEVRHIQLANSTELTPNVIHTEAGEATLSDISRGLEVAIAKAYTSPNDPVVAAVKAALSLARNGTPLRSAVGQVGLDLAILSSLGEIGIQAAISEPADPSPSNQDDEGTPEAADI
jgi:hypothetical protein